MRSLSDQFCPQAHDAPITAADYDSYSQTVATADALGVVNIRRVGTTTSQTIQMKGAVQGSINILQGGEMIAIGDESGSIGVFDTINGQQHFYEERHGRAGTSRAFRGVAINRQGSRLASISQDNILRVWDLQKKERLFQWKNFSGSSIHFDARGERILAITSDGQPNLIDLWRNQNLYLDRLKTPCQHACFTTDGTGIIAAGYSGFYLLEIATGRLIAGFATKGGQIVDIATSPDGRFLATVTTRSVHKFALPSLQFVESYKHHTPNPSNSAYWDNAGVWIGGSDGMMHAKGSFTGVPPVSSAKAFGQHKVSIHDSSIAIWKDFSRVNYFDIGAPIDSVVVNRDGNLIVVKPQNQPILVLQSPSGKKHMQAPPESSHSERIHIGGTTVAIELPKGGCYWWQLSKGKAFQLAWPRALSVSNGGELIALVTPKGNIRILNTINGQPALPSPQPLSNASVKLVSFVNRSPTLIVLDTEGVLSYYDLGTSLNTKEPAKGYDLLEINAEIDQIWGLSHQDKSYAVLRIPQADSCTLLWVPLNSAENPFDIPNLHPKASVDPSSGAIFEPSKSAAFVEKDFGGQEMIVYRSLPNGEWISFDGKSIRDSSPNANQFI